jgi:DNA-binding NarL/FixJ family response regulator
MEKLMEGKSHTRLLLADDHAIFSDALRIYLDKDFDIVGVVSDGRTLVDEAIRIKPDVIIADIGMPLLNGLDAARRIKELAPKIKFISLKCRMMRTLRRLLSSLVQWPLSVALIAICRHFQRYLS